jgi:hypothetical protein
LKIEHHVHAVTRIAEIIHIRAWQDGRFRQNAADEGGQCFRSIADTIPMIADTAPRRRS